MIEQIIYIRSSHWRFSHVGWWLSAPFFSPFFFVRILHLCMPLRYRLRKVVDSTELCAYLNGASLNIDSPIIITNPKCYEKPQLLWQTPISMTPTLIMTPKIWFRPVMDITIVLSCIFFRILIVKTELEQYPITISVTFFYCSYRVMEKIYINMIKK